MLEINDQRATVKRRLSEPGCQLRRFPDCVVENTLTTIQHVHVELKDTIFK